MLAIFFIDNHMLRNSDRSQEYTYIEILFSE